MPKKKNGRYRYTDDYRTVSYVDEKGRSRKRFVYTGKWFCMLNDADEYRRIVLTVRAASFISLAAVLLAMLILPAPVNGKWYLVPVAVSLFPLSYQLMGAAALPGKPKPMESAGYHRSVRRVAQSSGFCFAVLAASVAGLLLYWILTASGSLKNGAPYTFRDAVFAVCLVLAAGACRFNGKEMKKIRIEERENNEDTPQDETV